MIKPLVYTPLVLFGCVTCSLLVGVVATETAGQNMTGTDSGERILNTTTPAPGDTIEVLLRVELAEAAPVDYVDEFNPAFASGSYIAATLNGTETAPTVQRVDSELTLATFSEVGPGTLEMTYRVTVPDAADIGTIYEFGGTLRIGDAEVPVNGPSSVEISSDRAAVFTPSITGVDDTTQAGTNITVEYLIVNGGNASGTQTVSVSADETTVETDELSLDPNQTATDTAQYTTTVDDVPSVEFVVETGNGSVSRSANVTAADADDSGGVAGLSLLVASFALVSVSGFAAVRQRSD